MSTNNEAVTFPKGVPVNLIFPDGGINLNLNINLTVTDDRAVTGLLRQILDQQKEFTTMATALDDKITALQAAVAKETDVEKSAAALIQGFPALLADAIAKAQAAGATSQQLQAITDVQTAISTSSDALAGAVSANTTPAS